MVSSRLSRWDARVWRLKKCPNSLSSISVSRLLASVCMLFISTFEIKIPEPSYSSCLPGPACCHLLSPRLPLIASERICKSSVNKIRIQITLMHQEYFSKSNIPEKDTAKISSSLSTSLFWWLLIAHTSYNSSKNCCTCSYLLSVQLAKEDCELFLQW